ncbi:MAG: hypothetical protein HY674_10250 [Chloroflexi bacterium]|nr:hypothetical protein [Chloroflexota bacterium]
MKKEYRKALVRLFKQKIAEQLPELTEVKIQSPLLKSGDTVYQRCSVDMPLSCFVVFMIDHRGYDEFKIDLAWSKRLRFPELPSLPFGFASSDRQEFAEEEFSFRLSCLSPAIPDTWLVGGKPTDFADLNNFDPSAFMHERREKKTEQEIHEMINPLAEDAVDAIRKFAIPYFDRLNAAQIRENKGGNQ